MPKMTTAKVQQSHRAAPGSFSERRQLDAFRQALRLDALAFDCSGVGDAVGELLPSDAIPVLIVAGEGVSRKNGRWHIGKTTASATSCTSRAPAGAMAETG